MNSAQKIFKPDSVKTLLFGLKYMANYWLIGKDPPLICGLVLHNKCNLRCRHCTVVDRQTTAMSFDETVHVIDAFYTRGGRCLYLEGGEPFIWQDGPYSMEDVVIYAKEKGYYAVIIYTNGTKPIKSEADTIFVSVDGLQKTHDELRGKSFDKIMSHIRQSNHPSIYINYTINSVNNDDIAGFCEYVSRIPQIQGIFFYFHTPYYGYDDLFLGPEKKKEILLEILELKSRYKIINSRPGIKSAMRNDWKKDLDICSVYEDGKFFRCCRESNHGEICKDCGYLSYAEIDQTLKLKPGAIANALKYF